MRLWSEIYEGLRISLSALRANKMRSALATVGIVIGIVTVTLMNTAIAEAGDAAGMAMAMKLAVEAGRLAYLSGRMPKRLYASASSPIQGAIK